MRELKHLDKSLLVTEFDLARDLSERTQREGYGQHRAAAIIYKHGYLDGRHSIKRQKDEAYRKLGIAQEALTANGIAIPDYSRDEQIQTNKGDNYND